MWFQLRSAIRSLTHRPALATAIVVTLALGVGANSAIFSAVDAVLLKPLPFPAADRLVVVYESNLAKRQATELVAPGRLEEWNAMNQTFDGLAASYFENLTDTSGALPERVEARRTSPRFFSTLGVAAEIGRTPTPQEEIAGGPSVAVVSDGYWHRRFNADPGLIGRALTLGGAVRTVVGVMPPSFGFPTATTEVWIPTQAPRFFLEARGARLYSAFGRLKPGVTPEQGQADLSAVQARLAAQYPQTDTGWSAAVVPLKEEQVGGVRRSLWLLFGAVGLVLLAACGNIACLLLADAARRTHELAVCFALGASRGQVVGQLLLEGALLASAGAALGLVVAHAGIGALRLLATGLPRADSLRVDGRLVAFTLATAAATTLAFALTPAMRAARDAAAGGLGRAGRTHTGAHRLQRSLVAVQVSLAIVLLVGAGLLVRSFERLQQVSPGFDPQDVVTFRMSAQWSERTAAVMNRHLRTLARLEAIPGVVSAAFSSTLPAGIDLPPGEFRIVGRDTGEHLFASGRAVSADYFRTLRIPVLQGEVCRDDPATPFKYVVVTRAWAERFFPGDNPIGHRIQPLSLSGLAPQEIVAVVGDVREDGLARTVPEMMYTCGLQPYWPDPYFLVRVDPHRPVTAATIRDALRSVEPDRAMYAVRPLSDTLRQSTAPQRLNAMLLSFFGGTALLLAAIGLYGVLSRVVAGRRREIGVRMALGARPSDIISTVLVPAATMTLAGIATGLAGALALTRLMRALVFEVSVRDPQTFAAAPLLLAIVAALAALVPARRAARTDPMTALREE